jgi:hypothetical protein
MMKFFIKITFYILCDTSLTELNGNVAGRILSTRFNPSGSYRGPAQSNIAPPRSTPDRAVSKSPFSSSRGAGWIENENKSWRQGEKITQRHGGSNRNSSSYLNENPTKEMASTRKIRYTQR